MTCAPSALRADGRSRSAGSGPPRGPVSWSSSRGTSCGCPASERSPPRYRWTSTTQGGSRACSDANPFSRPTPSSACVSAGHLVGRALRDVRCGRSSVVHAGPRQRLRTGVDRAPPPGKTNPGPRHGAGDAGDEPREARVRRDRDRHLVERDQEGEGCRESRGPGDRVSRGRHPDVEAAGWLRRRHHRPGRVPRPSAGETVGVCGHRPPDPRPHGWLLLKCFSDKQPGTFGPYRISSKELRGYFAKKFEILSIADSTFQGTLKPNPKTLFATFRRS